MIGYLSKKKVYTAPYFDVYEQVVEREGKPHSHFIVHRKPVVSILPVTPQGEVYLINQVRVLLEKVSLEGIAGHVDDGEDIEEAALRELKEETGLVAKTLRKIAAPEASASVVKSVAHIFIATDLSQEEAAPEPGEQITLVKIPISEAVQKVMSGEINTATSMIGILLLDRMQREGRL